MDTKYKVVLPEGKSGNWKVERFKVTEEQAMIERMRALTHDGRGVPEGTYTRLVHNGHVVMSDTPNEIRDHYPMILNARDDVLINGLGLSVLYYRRSSANKK